jgi:phosphatidylglycerophosphatase C
VNGETTDANVTHVAAFDVDGTLTVRDCVRPFLVELGGWHGIGSAVLRRPFATSRAALRRDRDAVKEIVVGGVLHGRVVADVEVAGAAFAARVHGGWLRADTLQRLRWHQRSGHRVVLVSASLGPYLRPLGDALAVDAVLCTDVVMVEGRFEDRLDGGNCRATEKARRLDAWLTDEGIADATVWAYGDSSGDTELLARATYPLRVDGIVVTAAPIGPAVPVSLVAGGAA